jgi:hypothetical protein
VSTLTSYARALAVETGQARRLGTVRHLHVHDRPLVIVPLTLAGETNAPIAAMAGTQHDKPAIILASQPRLRSKRLDFAAELADVVLPFINACAQRIEYVTAGRDGTDTRTRMADAPQLWVPNPGGISYLRMLGRMTRLRRSVGEYAVPLPVPEMGKWLTWFAEQAEFADTSLLHAATRALRGAWATGQSSVEDGNLGALMAWIAPPPGQTGAQAASRAEDPVLCPPAGPSTDPTFDAVVLKPALDAIDAATSDSARTRLLQRLADDLTGQLQPTWDLVWQAIDLLRALPAGNHVPQRWERDRENFTGYYQHLASDGRPQARRDNAERSARRLNDLERRLALYDAQRAFDDPMVMAEYRMGGEAFCGTVIHSEPGRTVTPGSRRVLRPLIVVETADPLRLLPGDADLTDQQRPKQTAAILDVEHTSAGTKVTLELSGGMGRGLTATPGSVPQPGGTVTYSRLRTGYSAPGMFPDRDSIPWTHGGPPAQHVPTADDAREEWS